jgi:hypothetical protein
MCFIYDHAHFSSFTVKASQLFFHHGFDICLVIADVDSHLLQCVSVKLAGIDIQSIDINEERIAVFVPQPSQQCIFSTSRLTDQNCQFISVDSFPQSFCHLSQCTAFI